MAALCRTLRGCSLLLIAAMLPSLLEAQAVSGDLIGTIIDSCGAVAATKYYLATIPEYHPFTPALLNEFHAVS